MTNNNRQPTTDNRQPTITSPANERLKHARRVREGREADLIFIEGERLAEECLQAGLSLAAGFFSSEPSARTQAIIDQASNRRCPLYPVAEAVMANLSDTVNPQGIVLLAARPQHRLEDVLNRENPLIVCLDAVQDPGNVGAILRTAEAAGAAGAFLIKGSAEPFAPKTLRSSMGSAFRLPIVAGVEIDDLLRAVQAKQIEVATTTSDGDSIYSDYDWRRPTMVVFGNEANGVSRELLERAGVRLRIPLCEPVESLNVAAAAAAVLFESARQRSVKR